MRFTSQNYTVKVLSGENVLQSQFPFMVLGFGKKKMMV